MRLAYRLQLIAVPGVIYRAALRLWGTTPDIHNPVVFTITAIGFFGLVSGLLIMGVEIMRSAIRGD